MLRTDASPPTAISLRTIARARARAKSQEPRAQSQKPRDVCARCVMRRTGAFMETTLPPQDSTLTRELSASDLRARLDRGVDAAIASLPLQPAPRSASALSRVSTCTIGAIEHDMLTAVISADVIAGVVQRFDGAFRGTALLALEPGDALLWLQAGKSQEEPLARFVALGTRMLEAVIASVADGCGEIGTSPGALEERPLMAALLATHAPSDTVIVSLDAAFSFELDPTIGALHTPFTLQLLFEPKVFHLLFGVSSVRDEASERGTR